MTDGPSQAWVLAALKITGHFEDANDPLAAVSGDFDGMGISLGVLQWNIGSGSLQPMVKAVGREAVVAAMPVYGDDLWKACTSDVQDGLAICRGWQAGSVLRQPVRLELRRFTGSEAFVQHQLARAGTVASSAYVAAEAFAAADPSLASVTKAVFCWFFDVYTQNGGLKGLTYEDAAAFVERAGADRADDIVCDWLASRSSAFAGFRDARRNAELWRGRIDSSHLSLFALSYLRAQKARLEYRADVLNRKATIALGHGWVHGEKHDLAAILAA